MKPIVKRVLKVLGGVVGIAVVGAGGYVYAQTSAFDASMKKVYDVPPLNDITHSTDPAVIARGQHLASSLAGCALHDCHGPELSGGPTFELGPLGRFSAPNITPTGAAGAYTDGELARLIKHGIKKDDTSVRFMPVQEVGWLPDSDVAAVISYVRTAKPSDKPNGPTEFKMLAKVLDRRGELIVDVARHIDHTKVETPPPPAPTAEYGAFVARLCTGCHGEHLAGGPIPGAPPSLPIPLNLTPDATGLKGWTYDDFMHVIETGARKSGKKLDPMMPVEALRAMNDDERHALWAFISSVPARPFGDR